MDKPATTDHDIHPLLAKRWSNRAFTEQAVSDADLGAVLEAARWAPSCFNEQPWRFVIAKRGTEAHRTLVATLSEGNQGWASKAPVLLLSVARSTFTGNDKPNRHAWHDVGLAVMSLSVEATQRGLGLHQMAGFDPAAARTAFGVPEGYEPVSVIALGHAGPAELLEEPARSREAAPRARKPASELFFDGAWPES